MELKDLKQIMHDKGYTVNYSTANGEMVCMSKYVEDKDVWIHAEIYEGRDQVELSCILQGLFTIKTDKFQITHPKFEALFESRLINMAYKAVYQGL